METKSIKICGGRIESPLGSTLGLSYVGPDGERYPVPIYNGKRQNHFYALFDEEDVDFEIDLANSFCDQRAVLYGIESQNTVNGFLVNGGIKCTLKTLVDLGPKLHFVRQSSDDGLALIVRTADKHNITFDKASELLSQIKFDIEYSIKIGEPFDVYVVVPEGDPIKFRLDYSASIADLKKAIKNKIGVDERRQSIFNHKNKELADHSIYREVAGSRVELSINFQVFVHGVDDTTMALNVCERTTSGKILALIGKRLGMKMSQEWLRFGTKPLLKDVPLKKYGVKEKDILHVSMKLLGGEFIESGPQDSDVEVGERGAICGGEKSDQKMADGFVIIDQSIKIEPFVIELRMNSHYNVL